jgi:hypothetical protein
MDALIYAAHELREVANAYEAELRDLEANGPEVRTDGFEARRLLLKDRAFYDAHVSAMFKRIQDTEMVCVVEGPGENLRYRAERKPKGI